MSVTIADHQPDVGSMTSEDHELELFAEAEWWALLASRPAGDPLRVEARNALVALHLPLVHTLARRYRDSGESLDDLIQVGSVGLLKAIDRFEPQRGYAFSTFATPTILGEVKRHFRDKTWMIRVPRPLQEMRSTLVKGRAELSQQLGRSPTIRELAAFIGVSEEDAIDGLEAANAYSADSLDPPSDGESLIGQTVERRLGYVDGGFDLAERRHCVAPLLDALPARDRRIIFLRFFREMTQTEIATELGISQMHVSRLLSQILSDLQSALARDLNSIDEVTSSLRRTA
jgi:RNA polymerase sigma-B factor